MQTLSIGDVTITSIIERDGPWRKPEDMFPGYDPERVVGISPTWSPWCSIRSQARWSLPTRPLLCARRKHTVLIDTCTGEDKGPPAADGFPQAAMARQLPGRGSCFRGHLARLLHASTHRPYRLEYHAAQWAMGSHLPQCEVYFSQGRIRLLGGRHATRRQSSRAMSGATIAGQSSRPDRRCWSTTPTSSTTRSSLIPTPGHSPTPLLRRHPFAWTARGGHW